jgi:hypothetical protein
MKKYNSPTQNESTNPSVIRIFNEITDPRSETSIILSAVKFPALLNKDQIEQLSTLAILLRRESFQILAIHKLFLFHG